MNSFRFFKKYFEGGYDKYSPFLTYIIEAVFKNDLLIVESTVKHFLLFNKKGETIADLILGNAEKYFRGNCMLLNESMLILNSKNDTDQIELSDELSKAEEKISKFFRKIYKKDNSAFSSTLKRDFLSLHLQLTHEQDSLKDIKKLDDFFRSSIQKKYRTGVLLKWVFVHRLFFEAVKEQEQYLEIIQKNRIFCLFQDVLKTLENKFEILSEESCQNISALVRSSGNSEITLEYIVERAQIALGEKAKEDNFTVSDLVKTKSKYLGYITDSITNDSEIIVSTSIGLNLTANILEVAQDNKVCILNESLGAFYLSSCFFAEHPLAPLIDYALIDLSVLYKGREASQKLFSNEIENENTIPDFKSAVLFVVDFIAYPTNAYYKNGLSPISKNYKNLQLKKETIRRVVEQLSEATQLVSLQENHLLYNHQFNDIRDWLGKNFSGEIEEIKLNQPLCTTIARLKCDNNTNGIYYKRIKHNLEVEREWQLPRGYEQWFPHLDKNAFHLHTKANNANAIFDKRFSALFSKEKKLPPVADPSDNSAVKLLKKPFNAPIRIASKYIFTDLEFTGTDFYSDNKFLCIAFDDTKKDSLVIITEQFPTYNFLDKLFCIPLLKGKTLNITDAAYLYFRNILISKVEPKFTENIRQKDQKLNKHIERLKKVTSSLPVLNKFSLRVEAIYAANKEERISKEVNRYHIIIEAFFKKVKVLKKDARERKKLLSTIEHEINQLLTMIQTFEKAENAYQKELSMLTKESLFFYSLAVLNSTQYKENFGYNLVFGEPKIPFLSNIWEWTFYGKVLSKAFEGELKKGLHLELKNIEAANSVKKLEQIKILKKIGSILINDELEIAGLPSIIWEYQLKGKSTVEWKVLELRKTYKGKLLDKKLKDKIVDEIKRSCNIAEQVTQTIKKINQLDFKLT